LSNQGGLTVISGPSGGGKTTVIREILKIHPEYDYSISTTTRPPRKNEVDGADYHFISRSAFEELIKRDLFIEFAEVHGEYYGTERDMIEREIALGKQILLDIDVIGGEAIRNNFKESILVFLSPPSEEDLENRLINRCTDSGSQIIKRLSRYPMERERGKNYQFRITNLHLAATVKAVIEIIETGELKENAHLSMV